MGRIAVTHPVKITPTRTCSLPPGRQPRLARLDPAIEDPDLCAFASCSQLGDGYVVLVSGHISSDHLSGSEPCAGTSMRGFVKHSYRAVGRSASLFLANASPLCEPAAYLL